MPHNEAITDHFNMLPVSRTYMQHARLVHLLLHAINAPCAKPLPTFVVLLCCACGLQDTLHYEKINTALSTKVATAQAAADAFEAGRIQVGSLTGVCCVTCLLLAARANVRTQY
jgi:hypothetical protein